MQFNDTITKSGILQDIETKVFGDDNYGVITNDSDRLFQFTNRVNRALDRYVFLAMTASGRWQWDDNNQTTITIATTNINANQRQYQFALEHLEIEKVLIKDTSGTWQTINPIDTSDINARAYMENNAGRTGTPTQYDKRGDTLFLDVTPNYTSSEGLKIYFIRGGSYFTHTDTTKTAGFAMIFHDYLSLHAGAMYAIDRQISTGSNLYIRLKEQEQSIKEYYSKRNRDERPSLKTFKQNNR